MHLLGRAMGSLAFFCLGSWNAYGITLSPGTNGGTGDIPAYCGTTDFIVSEVPEGADLTGITLPQSTCAGAVINIRIDPNGPSAMLIDVSNTDLPVRDMYLDAGKSITFKFNADSNKWITKFPNLSPKTVGAVIPANTDFASKYQIWDNNWTQTITLPETATPDAVFIVKSHAKTAAKIAPTNVLFASTMTLDAQDEYVFTFHGAFKKWYITKSPIVKSDPRLAAAGMLQATTYPRTELVIPAQMQSASITLPASAGDRDRFSVSSRSKATNTILNNFVDAGGTLSIRKGDVYNFMWVADKQRWVLESAPTRVYGLNRLTDGRLPAMSSPTAKIHATDRAWQQNIFLPPGAKPGDRILVSSNATWAFNVVGREAAANFNEKRIERGDTVAFAVNDAGQWTIDTPHTVTYLNVFADKVAAVYGGQAARARQIESVRMTNEALENSRANFRVKTVGMLQIPDQGTDIKIVLSRIRGEPAVVLERLRLKANAVFFEGEHDGKDGACGWGWQNAEPEFNNMVGVGSMRCGMTTMRHEMAHNLGVAHGQEAKGWAAPFARGYLPLRTVMGGNATPYYSTPLRYDPVLGHPLGVANEFDAVRAMNSTAPLAAAIR